MAQMTDSLAQAILDGAGVTRNELEQLAWHWLKTRAQASAPKRDRPSSNPGGVECMGCGCIFVGDETHTLCGVCYSNKHASAPEGGEAVAWQYRMVLATGRASDWQSCSEELFDYYVKRPMFDDTTIETRSLYTRSNAKAGEVDVARHALRFAARIVELYDDATMRDDHMIASGDCADILNAIADRPEIALSTRRGDASEMGVES